MQACDHLEAEAIAAAFPNCNRLRVAPTAHDIAAVLSITAAALPGLQVLTFSDNESISDDDMVAVARLRSLRELDIVGCRKVSDAGLAHVCSLPSLERLSIRRQYSVTDEGLAPVARLTTLKHLSLESCEARAPHVCHECVLYMCW